MAHCRTKEISSINELEEYYFKLSTEDFDVYHWWMGSTCSISQVLDLFWLARYILCIPSKSLYITQVQSPHHFAFVELVDTILGLMLMLVKRRLHTISLS